MLKGAAIFLVIGLVAALLGFTTIAGASFAVAKVLAGIFLFVFLMLLVMALFADPRGVDDLVTEIRRIHAKDS